MVRKGLSPVRVLVSVSAQMFTGVYGCLALVSRVMTSESRISFQPATGERIIHSSLDVVILKLACVRDQGMGTHSEDNS